MRLRPAASASSVLPVPALPTSVTRRIFSSSSRSSAYSAPCCAGGRPSRPSRGMRSGTIALFSRRSGRARVWFGAPIAEHDARVRVERPRPSGTCAKPSWKNVSISAPDDLELGRRRCRALDFDALVLVRLGGDAERVGADAEVRVHRDEHGRRAASLSRTSIAVCRMAWSCADLSSAVGSSGASRGWRSGGCRPSRAPRPSRASRPVLAKLVEQPRDRAARCGRAPSPRA